MITHGNLMHNCRAISVAVDDSVPHVVISWLPFFHDMGLVGTLFLPVVAGFPLVFMPPEAFVMKPVRWLQAITRYRGTLSPAPNSAYGLCVKRISPTQRAELDLTSWRFAFNGSERISGTTMREFVESFEPCGFRHDSFFPCYGLAESTLIVSGGSSPIRSNRRYFEPASLTAGSSVVVANEGIELVGCGKPQAMNVIVVEPENRRRCPAGRVGEIWVQGASVAAGYWGDGKGTAESFHAREADTGDGPYLRTGDLGFELDDEIFITGRLKDMIIVSGRNIYPEDIEGTVEMAHPAVCRDGAVAFAVDDGTHERLVVLVEVDTRATRRCSLTDLEQDLRDQVAERNDVAPSEIVLVRRRSLPKTPSGKKQRSKCRRLFLEDQLSRVNHE
jgi:acyl-CoA synthetase (AMP-forming)/AMP-acid ligase II